MLDANTIIRDRQCAIRRELDRRGIALKAVSFDSGIPYPTLLSYFPAGDAPAVMPASAMFRLCGAIPDDLLNLLAPDGYAIVRVPSGIDYDEVSKGCRDFLASKEDAHHPESELGREIGPAECKQLRHKAVALKAVA